MNYKAYLYVISIILSAYALSGLNFDAFMKKNKPLEARILVVLLMIVIGYIVTNFIVDFIEVSKIL